MIVFTKEQNDFLTEFLKDYRAEMNAKGLDIRPVEIKNNLFILSERVLDDPRCAAAKQDLISGGHLQKAEKRDVSPDEFIKVEFI